MRVIRRILRPVQRRLIRGIVGHTNDLRKVVLMLSPLCPEFKISPDDAETAYNVPNVTRKCKSCGKPFALINRVVGERVSCPECGAVYIIQKEIKFNVVIEQDPELTPAIVTDLNKYLRRYKRPENYRDRIIRVIEMAASDATLKEINHAVGISKRNIGSAKMWGRQRGLC